MAAQTEVLAGQVEQGFGQHPDAEIYRSQPGLGDVLGARVLAEFGDDPGRYADAKARKNYSGMSPITKASGTKRVVLARYARNRRPGDALFLQAFAARNNSPGARVPRPATSPRRHPLPSPPHPREPARRHPPRLFTNPHPLRRAPCLAQRTRQTQPCSLTASGRGMSSQQEFENLSHVSLRHAVSIFQHVRRGKPRTHRQSSPMGSREWVRPGELRRTYPHAR